jgi:hypothetical protein
MADDDSTNWLLLERNIRWRQPKLYKEFIRRRKILLHFLKYLISKKDKNKTTFN